MGGFTEDYWKANYSEPETMDGIANKKEHVTYIKSLFALEEIAIGNVIDLGCGLGHMLLEINKRFSLERIEGIEPSGFAFQETKKKIKGDPRCKKIVIKNIGLSQWCKESCNLIYDLTICMSVFQYLADQEIRKIIPVLAKRTKYLYLTVPTHKELFIQEHDEEFKDEYAIKRSKKTYLDLIRPHFKVVGSRVLESKYHFDDKTSFFTNLLYRF